MKKIIFIISVSIFLTACGGAESDTAFNPKPSLVHFDIVDSYGVDTATSNQQLVINPYIYNGMFDIFWKVNSLEDYQINIRINDHPAIGDSYSVYSEICGAGLACDQLGNVICEYTADFTLACNNSRHPTTIANLFKQVPQRLFLFVEICDLDSPYCTYDYYPVLME